MSTATTERTATSKEAARWARSMANDLAERASELAAVADQVEAGRWAYDSTGAAYVGDGLANMVASEIARQMTHLNIHADDFTPCRNCGTAGQMHAKACRLEWQPAHLDGRN